MNQELIEKLKARYLTMIEAENFDHFINPILVELKDGEAEVHWQPKPIHLNRFGSVHGGTFAGLIDTVAAITALTKLKRIVTIELNVSYLKAANLQTKIVAKGKVLHAGRSLLKVVVELFNEESQLLAVGNLTFFVLGELSL